MSAKEPDDTFVARWSRMKRAENKGTDAAATKGAAGSTKVEDDQNSVKADLSALPKIEDLLPTSDIRGFLQKGVPEELKRLALRKAWSLDPAIRDFVEVAENQFNWNAPDGVPGFGELPTGVDIEQLLAQATGAIEPNQSTAKSSDVVIADQTRSEQLIEQPSADSQDPRDGLPADQVQSASEPPSGSDDDKCALQQEDRSVRLRRRHGGALPI